MKVSNNKVGGSAGQQLDGVKNSRAEGAQSVQKDSGVGAAKTRAPRETNVALSERAQMMKKAKDIASDPSVDEAKVSRLQKLIDEGKYKVDADKIADRLVDQHMLIPDEP